MVFLRLVRAVLTVSLCILALRSAIYFVKFLVIPLGTSSSKLGDLMLLTTPTHRRLHYDPHAFLLPNRWKLLPQVIRGTGSRVYSSLPYAVDLRDL
eukprot:383377-Amorphochlora_amoeboformis.AAC.2